MPIWRHNAQLGNLRSLPKPTWKSLLQKTPSFHQGSNAVTIPAPVVPPSASSLPGIPSGAMQAIQDKFLQILDQDDIDAFAEIMQKVKDAIDPEDMDLLMNLGAQMPGIRNLPVTPGLLNGIIPSIAAGTAMSSHRDLFALRTGDLPEEGIQPGYNALDQDTAIEFVKLFIERGDAAIAEYNASRPDHPEPVYTFTDPKSDPIAHEELMREVARRAHQRKPGHIVVNPTWEVGSVTAMITGQAQQAPTQWYITDGMMSFFITKEDIEAFDRGDEGVQVAQGGANAFYRGEEPGMDGRYFTGDGLPDDSVQMITGVSYEDAEAQRALAKVAASQGQDGLEGMDIEETIRAMGSINAQKALGISTSTSGVGNLTLSGVGANPVRRVVSSTRKQIGIDKYTGVPIFGVLEELEDVDVLAPWPNTSTPMGIGMKVRPANRSILSSNSTYEAIMGAILHLMDELQPPSSNRDDLIAIAERLTDAEIDFTRPPSQGTAAITSDVMDLLKSCAVSVIDACYDELVEVATQQAAATLQATGAQQVAMQGMQVAQQAVISAGSNTTTYGTYVSTSSNIGAYIQAPTYQGVGVGGNLNSVNPIISPNDDIKDEDFLRFREERLRPSYVYKAIDGSTIEVDATGNYVIHDEAAQITYKATRVREFNRFVNGSDLVGEFIESLGKLGANQEQAINAPLEMFIRWLVFKAAEHDHEEPPEDVPPLDLASLKDAGLVPEEIAP